MIHGGAGSVPNKDEYAPNLEAILATGQSILKRGGSALDAVEQCVMLLEDDPAFNAGRGSVLNEEGKVEMDAAVMNGVDMQAGAIAGITNIKNPIHLARKVMEESEHVMLIGAGALRFAELMNEPQEEDTYFITEKRLKQLEEAAQNDTVVLDHSSMRTSEKKMGTVGAVARDTNGNLAAATSTGGITNKKFGRVGDSPIVGAGVFAENETCAVSATGFGEQFIRTSLSRAVSEFVRHKHMNAQEAADAAIAYLVHKVQGLGGVIVIDQAGIWGSSFSTEGMLHGRADAEGVIILS